MNGGRLVRGRRFISSPFYVSRAELVRLPSEEPFIHKSPNCEPRATTLLLERVGAIFSDRIELLS